MASPQESKAPEKRAGSADTRRPWMGLAAFTEVTQHLFFGRDAEISDIFVRVNEEVLTVLYGKSGLGKTSLLGAGLLPKLRVKGFRPALIRLRYRRGDPSLVIQVKRTLEKLRITSAEEESSTLWEVFHSLSNAEKLLESGPVVLIFDQGEEIFTLAQEDRSHEAEAFFEELGDLIENRPPKVLQERFEEDRRLSREFDFGPAPVRVVFTLREDYLSHLEDWKVDVPSVMRNRMPLHRLNGLQALEAVIQPGALGGTDLVSREVGESIVRFVARKEKGTPLEKIGAVPPLLSLVCEQLNEARIEQGLDEVTEELVESQSRDILDRFYEESFRDQPDELRCFVEDRMITDGGHRLPVVKDDLVRALTEGGATRVQAEQYVQSMIDRRLISSEDRDGVKWLELTHDVLSPLVVRSRDQRKERERLEEIERGRRRALRLTVIVSVIGIFILGLLIFSAILTRNAAAAERAAAAAERATAAAERATAEAEKVTAEVTVNALRSRAKALVEIDNALLKQRSELAKQRGDMFREMRIADEQLAATRIMLEEKESEIAGLMQELDGLRRRVEQSSEPSQDMAQRLEAEREINQSLVSQFTLLQQEQLNVDSGFGLLGEYLLVLRSSPVLLLGMGNYTDEALEIINERASQASQLYTLLSEGSRTIDSNQVKAAEQLGRDLLGAMDVLRDRAEFVDLSDEIRFTASRARILAQLADGYWFLGDRIQYGYVIAELRLLRDSEESIPVEAATSVALSYFFLEDPGFLEGGDQTFSELQGIRKRLMSDSDKLRRNLETEFRLRMDRVTRSTDQFIPSYREEERRADVEAAAAAFEELLRIIPEPRSAEDEVRIALMQAKLDVRSGLVDAFLVHRKEFASLDPEFLREGDIPSGLLYADFKHWQGLMAAKDEGEPYYRKSFQKLKEMERDNRLPAEVQKKVSILASLMSRIIGPNGGVFLEVPQYFGLYLSEQELTIGAYRKFVEATGHVSAKAVVNLPVDGVWTYQGDAKMSWEEIAEAMESTDDMPVSGISFDDAKSYCQWLTITERGRGEIEENDVYRLPRDSEWEAAAVDDLERVPLFPWKRSNQFGFPDPSEIGVENLAGQETNEDGLTWELPEKFANLKAFINYYRDRHVFLAPVKEYQRNAFGFYDMGGNVKEFAMGDTSALPLIRGGCFIDGDLESIRLDLPQFNASSSDNVWIQSSEDAWSWVGFRIAYERNAK